MRDVLAERLLATVMNWTPEDVARERPDLQALAAFKYDEYQQYSPGMRFVESLALWLDQFRTESQRQSAYYFVRQRLIFVSTIEMTHLVTIAFPDFIRPYLIERAAARLGISDTYVTRIHNSLEYNMLLRQSLFLGLSDGAHTDLLRRSTTEITHEQVSPTYDIAEDKAREMRDKLGNDLQTMLGREPSADEKRFRIIFLLDDFSGSGLSYLREAHEGIYRKKGRAFKGKLAKVLRSVDDGNLRLMVDSSDVQYCLVLYVATDQAKHHIDATANQLLADTNSRCTIRIVQLLPESVRLNSYSTDPFVPILQDYYNTEIMDEHLREGGDNVIFGFNDCGLPLILAHNTPNNSVYLLWAQPSIVPLFPRASRHRSEL